MTTQSSLFDAFGGKGHPNKKGGPYEEGSKQPKTDFICHAYNGISVLCGADHNNWSQVRNTLVNVVTFPKHAKWVSCSKCKELLAKKKAEKPPTT